MKESGMVRNIDSLGRFVIPREYRKKLNINNNDSLEMFVEGNSIYIRKYVPFCVFCGSDEKIKSFKGHNVCTKCVNEISGQ